jgi:hypothetical protein
MSESVSDEDTATIAAATKALIIEIAARLRVDCTVSDNAIIDLARFFLRDIQRIKEQQKDKVSSIKFAGYWGFWIRKLKPLSRAFKAGDDITDPKNEIITINEVVALEVSLSFLLRISQFAQHDIVIDVVRGACSKKNARTCNGSDCLRQATRDFMIFKNALNLKYLIHSMRHRTFGPHHFVTNLDHLVFSACRCAGGLLPEHPVN